MFQKLFWPTVRKNCSSDWEKLITRTIYFHIEGSEQLLKQNTLLTCYYSFQSSASQTLEQLKFQSKQICNWDEETYRKKLEKHFLWHITQCFDIGTEPKILIRIQKLLYLLVGTSGMIPSLNPANEGCWRQLRLRPTFRSHPQPFSSKTLKWKWNHDY